MGGFLLEVDMPIKKFDHEKLSNQIRELAKTHTLTDAAKELGLKRQQLIYICQKNKISFRPKGKRNYNQILDREDIPLILQLHEDGMKSHIIANKFDCCSSLIRKVVNGNAWL